MSNQEGNDSESWDLRQANTFKKWCNTKLKAAGLPLIESDLFICWADGIQLLHLIKALFKIDPIRRINKKVKNAAARRDNIAIAIETLAQCGIQKVYVNDTNLLEGKPRSLILGMIWMCILQYNIAGISEENQSARKGLLLWVQRMCNPHDLPVKNFSSDFHLARPVAAILSTVRPDVLTYSELNFGEEEIANKILAKALECGIPDILEGRDLADKLNIDDKAVMTYCAEMYHKFAGATLKMQAVTTINSFNSRVKGVLDAEQNYDKATSEFIEWCDKKIAEFEGLQIDDLTSANASEKLEDHRKYLLSEKPEKMLLKLEAEEFAFNAKRLLAMSNWREMQCEFKQEQLDERFDRLSMAETDYCEALRNRKLTLLKRPTSEMTEERKGELKDLFKRFDEDDDNLSIEEFEAVLMAANVMVLNSKKAFDSICNNERVNLAAFIKFVIDVEVRKDTAVEVKRAFNSLSERSDITTEELKHPGIEQDVALVVMENLGEDGRLRYEKVVDKFYKE